jgi:alpha-tubulin suppressor-like RCC1 family protein
MRRIVSIALCFLVVFALCPSAAFAASTITWNGGAGDGLWHTAGNWDLEQVPIDGDYVIIPESSEVEYAGGETSVRLNCAGNLTVSGGTLKITNPSLYENSSLINGKLDGEGDITITEESNLLWNGGSIEGSGSLIIENNANLYAIPSSLDRYLVNNGALLINGGSLRLTGGAEGSGNFSIQENKTLELGGNESYNLSSNVANMGTLKILDTCTSVNFNSGYTQQNTGTLEFDIGGLSDFTQLEVTGNAILNGELKINILGGYVPSSGDTFEILTCGSRTGEFASISSNTDGITFEPTYTDTGLTLTVSEAASVTVPTVPQNFTATPGDTQVALTWDAPASDGGAVISHYEVSADDGTTWVTASSSTFHTFTGLTNGTEYAFKVRAVNSAGNGAEASAAATPTAPAPTQPGQLYTWGNNVHGQLGDGTLQGKSIPTHIGTAEDWTTVSAGDQHTVALKSDGSLWTWGDNHEGRLGDGTSELRKDSPVRIGSDNDWAAAEAGDNHTVALKTNGSLWAWGGNSSGQLGDDSFENRNVPILIDDESTWIAVSAGFYHTVALQADGSLWAWGYNSKGQLGDGSTTSKKVPTQISTEEWAAVSAGTNFTVALKADGSLWAWGLNHVGQLGEGTVVDKNVPTRVGSDTWLAAAAGDNHVVAIKADGSLWAWGGNEYGELGNGSSDGVSDPPAHPVPAQIGTDTDWIFVSTSYAHNAAFKTDGSLWLWGLSSSGQLGDNTTVSKLTPQRLDGAGTWLAVACGGSHTVATLEAGLTVPTVPQNFTATPGDTQVELSWEAPASDGGTAISHYEVSEDGGTTWVEASTGTSHTFTGLTNGTMYTFKVRAVNSAGNGEEASITATPEAYVCEIGATKYTTLGQALAAVTSGQTIKLLNNNTHTSPIEVDGKTIYFDLGNYDLLLDTSDNPDESIYYVLTVKNGGKVRLAGTGTGKFNVKSSSNSISYGIQVLDANSEVTVNNVDVTGEGAIGIYMYGSGDSLDGGMITVNGHIIAGDMGVNVNAKNGSVIVNGDITAGHSGVQVAANPGTIVTVNGNINVLGTTWQSLKGAGILASGQTTVKVTGDVTGQGTNYTGVHAQGGSIEVEGDVISSGIGAKAEQNVGYPIYNGAVTIDGSLSAGTPFIIVGTTEKTAADTTEPTTKPGFLTYSDGTSNVWIGSVGGPVVTAPAAPQNFTATPGDTQVALSWTAPASDGGSAILKYQISKDNGANWTDVGLNTSHTFTDLTNGTEYTFKVRAVNSAGNGAEASAAATPTEYVCEIGTIKYATLDAALAAVGIGETKTITLLQNIDYDQGIALDNQKITFELNEYTLNLVSSVEGVHALGVYNGGGVALSGTGALNVTGPANGCGVTVHSNSALSEVTVTNASAFGPDSKAAHTYGQASLTVLGDATATGIRSYGIHAQAGSTLEVQGSVSADHEGVCVSAATARVMGNVQSSGNDLIGNPEGIGISVYNGAAEIGGNVTANRVGAMMRAGGSITLDGILTAPDYIQFADDDPITIDDYVLPTTKAGYRTYQQSSNTVWIKGEAPPAQYSITVENDGNGTASANIASAAEGSEITLTATPANGYQFKEWQVISGGVTISVNSFIMPGQNVTVKAIFEPVPTSTHTVNFYSDSSLYASKTVTSGSALGANWPKNPSKSGYSFDGWFTGSNGAGTMFSSFTIINADVALYPKWTYIGGSSGSGRGRSPSVPTYQAQVKTGSDPERAFLVTVNNNTGNASIEEDPWSTRPQGRTIVTIPSIPGTGSYSVSTSLANLSKTDVQGMLTFNTDAGSITVSSNMLTGIEDAEGNNAQITIGKGDKSNLPEEVKDAIGDRPLVQLTLSIDGKPRYWNNPEAPVTVSIPYTPTAAELAHPESIVVWYIDGSGNTVPVSNGQYDPETGTVTFTTTHFSYYAVGYNQVNFKDVVSDAWYAKAVSFIAAREITTGTGSGNFSPEAKLTRGQFIVMLMRAYAIAPDLNPQDNFADAGSAYYTSYLAAAKRLGISAGVGDNMFAPEKEITRQEMFTLLYNALKAIGQLPQNDSGKVLSDFSDAEQIDAWAKDALNLLVRAGIIGGSNGKLSPLNTTTRVEMAQVLYNLLGK